ncbi:tape measure protein [Caulobacter sp. CCNWLY153]|uniref:tape measure protein n=1 Tax=unclassified Caulobacter TaxID=2648921 RepID=UPI002FF09668
MTTREARLAFSTPGAEAAESRIIRIEDAQRRLQQRTAAMPAVLRQQSIATDVLSSVSQSASAKITSLTNSIGPLGAGLGAISRAAAPAAQGIWRVAAAQERLGLMQRMVNTTMLAGVGVAATGGIALAAYADDIIRAGDSYASLHARIVTFSEGQAKAAQNERAIYAAAKDARTSVADLTTLYTRLAPAVKDYGRSQEDALVITQLTSKALAIQGADVREQAAATVQFSQAIASGVLRGDELRSLMESSPQLLRYIAQNLEINGKTGIAFSQLRKLGEEGSLATDKIIAALLKAQPAIERDFINAPKTAQQGWIVLKDEITRTIGQISIATGAQQGLVKWLGDLTNKADQFRQKMLLDPDAFDPLQQTASFLGDAIGTIGDLGAQAVKHFDLIVAGGQAILALKLGSVLAEWFAAAARGAQAAVADVQKFRAEAALQVAAKQNPAAVQAAQALRAAATAQDFNAVDKRSAADLAAARAAAVRSAAEKAVADATRVRLAATQAGARAEEALASVERQTGREVAAAQRLRGEAAQIRAALEEDAARRSAAAAKSRDAAAASSGLSSAGIGTAGTYYARLAQGDAKQAMLFTDEQRRQQLARLAEIEVAEARAAATVQAAEQRKAAVITAAETEIAQARNLSVAAQAREAEATALVTAAERAEAQSKTATTAATNASAAAATRHAAAKEAEALATANVTRSNLAMNAAMRAGLGLYNLLGGAIGIATIAIAGLIYAVIEAEKAERARYEAMRSSVDITDRLKASTDAMAAATWAEIPGIMAKTKALRDQAAAQEAVLAKQLQGKQARYAEIQGQLKDPAYASAAQGLVFELAGLEKEIKALGGIIGGANQREAARNQQAFMERIQAAAAEKGDAQAQLARGTDGAGRKLDEAARDRLTARVGALDKYLVGVVDKLDADIAIIDKRIAAANKPRPRGQSATEAEKAGLGALRANLGTARDAASAGALAGSSTGNFTPTPPKQPKVAVPGGVSAAYGDLLKSGFLRLDGGQAFSAKDGSVFKDGKELFARSEDEATALAKYVRIVESLNDATDAQIKKKSEELGVSTRSREELKQAAGAVLARELATSRAAQADDKWADIKAEMDGQTRSEIKAQRELNDLREDGATITDEAAAAYLAYVAAREKREKLQRGLQSAGGFVQQRFDLAMAGTVTPTDSRGVVDEQRAVEQLMNARQAVILDKERVINDAIARLRREGEVDDTNEAQRRADMKAAYEVAVEIQTQDRLLEIRRQRLQESTEAQRRQAEESAEMIGGAIKDAIFGGDGRDIGKQLVNDILSAAYDELLGNPIKDLIKTALDDIFKTRSGGGGLWSTLVNTGLGFFGKGNLDKTVATSIAANPNLFADGRIPGYRDGRMSLRNGYVLRGRGGPRGDENLAWLSDGEGVINARSTAKYGDLLHLINTDRLDQRLYDNLISRHADGYVPRGMGALPMPASARVREGDVILNDYSGEGLRATKRRDDKGNTHIDLRPAFRAGVRDAARSGDVRRGLNEEPPPKRRG